MLAPLEVSIFLNNALSATHVTAEIDSDTPIPESSRDMPSQVSGRFAGIDNATSDEIVKSWKRVMRLNETPVIYDFQYDPAAGTFTARRR
jgi:hypothetical protein